MSTTVAFAQFTRQQAIDKVLNEIVVADTGNINVYAAYSVKNYQDTISLNYDTILLCPYNYNWVFFVDDYPIANWNHACRYIFMDSLTGDFQIINENQYPECFNYADGDEYEMVSQVYSYPVAILPPNQDPPDYTTTANDNLYAVLIVTEDAAPGAHNENPNRFWYDVSLVYNTLIQVYGYTDENIFVHYWDGSSKYDPSDLNENNGENHIDYNASKSRILETFDNLSGVSTSDPNIPILGPSDQLFVYIDGHGDKISNHSTILCDYPGPLYENLKDYNLADAVEGINCAEMIFLIQPCNSGNFAYELTDYNSYNVACENRIVHTSTSIDLLSTSEHYLTDDIYTEFTFYWTAAVRGYYPIFWYPWVESEYTTGSFPFDDLYPFNDHPDDYNPDLNDDGFVQMEEAFLYADDMDAWSPNGYHHPDNYCWECYEEPENENTMGIENTYHPDNLTTLYGLAGTVGDYTEIIGNRNYLVGNTLTLDEDLDIFENANIYISGENARIDIVDGDLLTYSNVSFYGSEINDYDDFFMGQQNTFNNCNINVDGDIEVGQQATFNYMELYLNNHSLQTTFNNATFNQSTLHNYGIELTINNDSHFNDCIMAYSHLGNINVDNTTFVHTWLYLENQLKDEDFMATITDCNFSTNYGMAAIDLWNYDRFFISNNTIGGNYYNGIQLMNSGEGASGNQNIFENEIMNCTRAGIHAYNSTSSIASNNIHNNYYGICLYNNCNTDITGNPSATTYSESQQIRDNESYEILVSFSSFPWYLRHNVIIDEDNIGNPDDPMVNYTSSGSINVPLDVRYNCWGNNFNPIEDLNPYEDYIYDPTWCPGGGSISQEAAETLYLSGKALYDTANYTSAKSTFEMVISQYPETKYASASMKDLFTIEKFVANDYGVLQQYYNTNSIIQADSILTKLSIFLANKCDVEMENWQPSINHYEDIINYPETPEDSIFAIIDLGNLYFLMENSGGRSLATGMLKQYIPTSKEEFFKKRNYLLSLLPFKNDKENNYKFDPSEGNVLLQNYPNPLKSSTMIYYQLKEQGEGYLKVFNNVGEQIRKISFSNAVGLHNIELDMSNQPVGIYYYSMLINGKRTDTKRMVVVN